MVAGERVVDIDPVQHRDAEGPRDKVGDLEHKRRGVPRPEGLGHLAHFLDETPERAIASPRAVSGSERCRDLRLERSNLHRHHPG